MEKVELKHYFIIFVPTFLKFWIIYFTYGDGDEDKTIVEKIIENWLGNKVSIIKCTRFQPPGKSTK